MLPKILRLPAKSIIPVIKKGKYKRFEYFHISYSLNPELLQPKVAISISKRIDNRATARNLIKRRIRSSIQELVKRGEILSGEYLIIVKSAKLAERSVDIDELLLKAFSEIR